MYADYQDMENKFEAAKNEIENEFDTGEIKAYKRDVEIRKIDTTWNNFNKMLETEANFHKSSQIVWLTYVPAGMRYVPGKIQRVRHAAYWRGMLKDGVEEILDPNWIKDNILDSVVKFVMSNANTRYRLPAGDTRVNIPPQEPLGTRWIPPDRPKLKYLQKDERTCVYTSFASCMHYLGYEKFAKLTHNISGRKSENVNNLKNLRKTMKEHFPRKFRQFSYNRDGIDILNHDGILDDRPTLVILEGDDGGVEHAITIYNCWIFDSNLEEAIPLTQNSLNWCCLGKYVCIAGAISYQFGPVRSVKQGQKKKLHTDVLVGDCL